MEAPDDTTSQAAVQYQQLGLGRLTRRVSQRRRSSLANHLRSIYLDSQFVRSVVTAYRPRPPPSTGAELQEQEQEPEQHRPSFAVFANLRNGEWYLSPEAWDGRVYFKSTDGHSGHWDFSRSRLNLHLALEAARRGGAIVVDSTRRGKAYPDALTCTLPIWCWVLNNFVASLIPYGDGDADDPQQHLYLPPWVPPSERDRILARLPSLLPKLTETLGPGGSALGQDLLAAFGQAHGVRPFRPVWVKQGDPLWQLPGVGARDFVPLVCVSASRERAAAEHRERFSWPYIQGAADDAEHWAVMPREGGEPQLMLTPGVFWAHAGAILPGTTAALRAAGGEDWEGEVVVPLGGTEEGEEDAVVERRVRRLLLTAASRAPGRAADPAAVVAAEPGSGPWYVEETGICVGSEACLRHRGRWGGVVRFVALEKGAVAERRGQGGALGEAGEGGGGLPLVWEEVDEGEGRRGELAREGLPRAIVAFRRYLRALPASPWAAAPRPPPFLVVCPTGTAHAPVLAAALLLAAFQWTASGGWVLRPVGKQEEDATTEGPYLPSVYHQNRRLGPLKARPALPRLTGLPRLTDKGMVRRALASVQRAMGQAGVVPPSRALQKELWSLFSGDTSNCSSNGSNGTDPGPGEGLVVGTTKM